MTAALVLALGNGLSTNVSNTYLSRFAQKGNAAQILAWGTRADTVGNILGPFLTYLYLINSTIPFWVAAFFGWLGAVMCILLMVMKKHAMHSKHETEERKSLIAERKEAAMRMKQLRESRENKRDETAKELRSKIHPACFRGLYGEDSEQMAILSDHLYQELKKKNHMYMISSGVKVVRERGIIAHKDLITKFISTIPAPDDATGDKEFIEGVGLFLAESGHEDWALRLPGMTPQTMINLLKTPS